MGESRVTARLHRVRPATLDRTAEALQLALELPLGLSPAARGELREALAAYRPDPWVFFMQNPIAARRIMQLIRTTERPAATLAVWTAALTYIEAGTNEIRASRRELAEASGESEQEVSRGLAALARLGALERIGRGRYRANPESAWRGTLAARGQAAEAARRRAAGRKPELRVVEPA
jgi:hypothetical protein